MTSPDFPAIIARVKQLDAEATPGPWVGEPDGGPHRGRVEERSARGIETVAYTYCGAYDGHGARNAELVAYYRAAAPLLATALEAAMAENERLREALREIAGYDLRAEHSESAAHEIRDEARAALEGKP